MVIINLTSSGPQHHTILAEIQRSVPGGGHRDMLRESTNKVMLTGLRSGVRTLHNTQGNSGNTRALYSLFCLWVAGGSGGPERGDPQMMGLAATQESGIESGEFQSRLRGSRAL